MVLVDVCGKGVGAGTQSLQFAGALGGLIGSLPPLGLFSAANDFLLRQQWDEGFATAVHVLVHLDTGEFSIINAGHPPALRWVDRQSQWQVDGARGTALGVLERPDFHRTTGVIEPGDALMFYTDGVVESRWRDFRNGIDWLRATAGQVVMSDGFDNAPRRILAHVPTGDDDRAVLVLDRDRPLVDYSRPPALSRRSGSGLQELRCASPGPTSGRSSAAGWRATSWPTASRCTGCVGRRAVRAFSMTFATASGGPPRRFIGPL